MQDRKKFRIQQRQKRTAGKRDYLRDKRTVTSQITRPIVIFIALMILVSAVFLFVYDLHDSVRELYDEAERVAFLAAEEMESYKSLPFLVRYWDEHYESMDLVPGGDGALREKEMILAWKLPESSDISNVTAEDAGKLDAEGQKLFAEICYSWLCESFDMLKKVYKADSLSSLLVKGDTIFYQVAGTLEDEKRISEGGEAFEPGVRETYEPGTYRILDEILSTHTLAGGPQLSLRKGAEGWFVHYFYPVYIQEDEVEVIGVTLPWRELFWHSLRLSGSILLFYILLFALIGVRIYTLIRNLVEKPLMQECRIIQTYEADKNSQEASDALIAINTDNELELLADSFSSMVTELDRYMDDIRAATTEKEHMETELALAARIQADMLPDVFPAFPGHKEFDIYATMTPAREVGGDFYDIFMLDDDHLALVMADVSGKGIPAALFMMMSMIQIRSHVQSGLEPDEVMRQVNMDICENNQEKMFVTVWLGILNLRTGMLKAVNAGHEYPILREPGGQFELIRDTHSFIVGGMEEVPYKAYEMQLRPGTRLFLYTDGVPEATDEAEQMFGTDRLTDVLNSVPDGSPQQQLEAVDSAVRSFVKDAPQFDDMTMMCLYYAGRTETSPGTGKEK